MTQTYKNSDFIYPNSWHCKRRTFEPDYRRLRYTLILSDEPFLVIEVFSGNIFSAVVSHVQLDRRHKYMILAKIPGNTELRNDFPWYAWDGSASERGLAEVESFNGFYAYYPKLPLSGRTPSHEQSWLPSIEVALAAALRLNGFDVCQKQKRSRQSIGRFATSAG